MPSVPGKGGGIPKRECERRRRNKPDVPTTHVESDGQVRGPELEGEHSDLARRFWGVLRTSGESVFYEGSDWLAAEILVVAIDAFVAKPSAFMLGQINSYMGPLLIREGDRRRLRVELERPGPVSEESADVSELAEWRSRLGSG